MGGALALPAKALSRLYANVPTFLGTNELIPHLERVLGVENAPSTSPFPGCGPDTWHVYAHKSPGSAPRAGAHAL
jgi:hypothetical protein